MSASSQPNHDTRGPNINDRTVDIKLVQSLFGLDPGVGVSIVDEHGYIEYVNARTAELFKQGTPEEIIGRTMQDLFDEPWIEERLRVFQQVKHTGRPVVIRSIRHGRRIQSTIRGFSNTASDDEPSTTTPKTETPTETQTEPFRLLVVTIEGTSDPAEPDAYDIVESQTASFGELNPLTTREIEVLALIGHGLTAQDIAAALHRSPRTIERHTDAIRAKLGRATRVQLAEFARRAGLRVEDGALTRLGR